MKKHPFAAFTLIELLTVIAIIGILAAIIIPTVGKVRQTARQAQSASNLRQIGLALNMAADDNRDRFPPASTGALYRENNITLVRNNAGFAFFMYRYIGFTDANGLNASRIMMDPLIANKGSIGSGNSSYAISTTWAGNQRLMGAADRATVNFTNVEWKTGNDRGVPRSSVSRPSQVVLVGSTVVDTGNTWGGYANFSTPSSAINGTDLDTVITPEPGNTTQEGGAGGGIAYRASGGNAAMFVMVDGSVKVIPKNKVKTSHFAAEL
ncbi:MAG: DUF1559 domain-containing protein [Opitutaceae bacterium]|jgi:prepilin-type N-terminal cleavage/methylation domain-containing protein|nr:DUF1559 domain-containing protein [Opitutaceae bacterium]